MNQLLIILAIVEWGICIVMALVILRQKKSPAAATVWLMLVFFMPEFGLLMYLLFGVRQLGATRKKLHRKRVAEMHSEAQLAMFNRFMVQAADQANPDQQLVMRQAEGVGGMPTVAGCHVELIGNGNDFNNQLIEDINQARHHAHLLFYIYAPDETGWRVAQALIAAARRGVQCRLMVDLAGSIPFFRSNLPAALAEAGVQVVQALPVRPIRRRLARIDLRNHRKIVVIDGSIAYTGSQNIVNEDYGHKRAGAWIDLMGRFKGPIVNQLQAVFLQDWAFETQQELDGSDYYRPLPGQGDMLAQCVPTGPNHQSENFRDVLLTAINASKSKLVMTSPYIVLDEPTLVALSMAARRGVDVRIVLPRRCDHPLVSLAGKAYYQILLDSGVNIHFYRKGMLHSKTITIDDNFALLGTANLDVRSFFLNFEVNVVMYGQQITHEMRFVQQGYMNDSDQLTHKQWQSRPMYQRYLESAAALFSPLL